MAKTLTGAVLTVDSITVSYTEDGVPGVDDGPWSSSVTTAATTLRSAVATALGSDADRVQVYTAASDPDGAENADPGDIVDAWDGGGGNPDMRFGDEEAVPDAVATARDAFKSAVEAAL
ncbi:MAG: hypothetical protein RJQ08_03810 [Salinisphaeraceae bacterium]